MNERSLETRDWSKKHREELHESIFLQRLSSFLKSIVGLNDGDQYFIPDDMKDDKLVVGLGGVERATELLSKYKKQKEQKQEERITNYVDSPEEIARAKAREERLNRQYATVRAITDAQNRIWTEEEKEQGRKQTEEYREKTKDINWREFYQQAGEREHEEWLKIYGGMTCVHFITWWK